MGLKKISVNLTIFLVSLTVCLFLLDLAIGFIFPFCNPRGILRYRYYPEDDILLCVKGFRGRQWISSGDYNVSVRINGDGFRDKRNISDSRPVDFFVVGDSFSFGHGVDEDKRYSDQLASMTGKNFFNISSPGNLLHYWKLIDYARKKGAPVNKVILGVCMENDLFDYEAMDYKEFESGCAPSLLASVKEKLKLYSAAYNLMAYISQKNRFLKKFGNRFGIIVHTYGIINDVYPDKVMVSSADKIGELCRLYDVTAVIIPSRGLWVGEKKEKELQAHNKFIRLLKERNINTVDLKPYLEKDGDPLSHYFKNDAHWNISGHRLAAEAIASELKKRRQ